MLTGTQTFPNRDTRVQTELALVSFRASFNCHLHSEVGLFGVFFFFFWPPHLPRQTSLPSLGFLSLPLSCSCHLCSTYPVLCIRQLIHLFLVCYPHANLNTRAHPLASFIHCRFLRAWHLGGAQ